LIQIKVPDSGQIAAPIILYRNSLFRHQQMHGRSPDIPAAANFALATKILLSRPIGPARISGATDIDIRLNSKRHHQANEGIRGRSFFATSPIFFALDPLSTSRFLPIRENYVTTLRLPPLDPRRLLSLPFAGTNFPRHERCTVVRAVLHLS